MKTLAVDTALGACSAAVLDGEKILAHRFEVMERGHAERLAPMVDEVMREAGTAFAGLDRLGVTTGPGTFTGQRVGLAFVRGLLVALQCSVTGVTTLEAIARQAMAEENCQTACVLHDAKRGEVYFGISDERRERVAPKVIALDDAIAELRELVTTEKLVLAGTAAHAAFTALANPAIKLSPVRQPDALWVARLARERPQSHDAPRPLYLRPSDAQLPAP